MGQLTPCQTSARLGRVFYQSGPLPRRLQFQLLSSSILTRCSQVILRNCRTTLCCMHHLKYEDKTFIKKNMNDSFACWLGLKYEIVTRCPLINPVWVIIDKYSNIFKVYFYHYFWKKKQNVFYFLGILQPLSYKL